VPISGREEWVQVAELDNGDRIWFTAEFRDVMGNLGWAAKAFVGHLLGLWYDPFEHILDYTSGEAVFSRDQPGSFDRNDLDGPQDVVEYGQTLGAGTANFTLLLTRRERDWTWTFPGTVTFCARSWSR